MRSISINQLESALEVVLETETETAQVCAYALKIEIKRRKNAGRPRSRLSRREQNRVAQQKFRNRQKDLQSKQK